MTGEKSHYKSFGEAGNSQHVFRRNPMLGLSKAKLFRGVGGVGGGWPTKLSAQFIQPWTFTVQGADYFGMLSPKRKWEENSFAPSCMMKQLLISCSHILLSSIKA